MGKGSNRRRASVVFRRPRPKGRGLSARVQLVVRDPRSLFAYWSMGRLGYPSKGLSRPKGSSLRPGGTTRAGRRGIPGPLVLRLYLDGRSLLRRRRDAPFPPGRNPGRPRGRKARPLLQFSVDGRNSCYLPVPEAGAFYRAEIGFVKRGRFVPLARSRSVRTPPDRPAPPLGRAAGGLYAHFPELDRQGPSSPGFPDARGGAEPGGSGRGGEEAR